MRSISNKRALNQHVQRWIQSSTLSAFRQAFDDLLLMKVGGSIIYHGEQGVRSAKLIAYFEVRSFPLSFACNGASGRAEILRLRELLAAEHPGGAAAARGPQPRNLDAANHDAWSGAAAGRRLCSTVPGQLALQACFPFSAHHQASCPLPAMPSFICASIRARASARAFVHPFIKERQAHSGVTL